MKRDVGRGRQPSDQPDQSVEIPIIIPSGQFSPLDETNLGHREALQLRMRAWLEGDPTRTQDDLFNLLQDRLRHERSDLTTELDMKPGTLRAFLNRPYEQRLAGHMNLAYRALDQEGYWDRLDAAAREETSDPDKLFHALHNFVRVPTLTTVALTRRLPGVYRVYRPILTHPGCFVRGFIAIESDPATGVMRYREYNRTDRREGREEKVLILHGYAFKKSALIYLVASDKRRNGLHVTILTGQEKSPEDDYCVLNGGFLDTMGNQAYSGRVFMERIPGVAPSHSSRIAELEAESVMKTAEEIPPSILAYFRGMDATDVKIY